MNLKYPPRFHIEYSIHDHTNNRGLYVTNFVRIFRQVLDLGPTTKEEFLSRCVNFFIAEKAPWDKDGVSHTNRNLFARVFDFCSDANWNVSLETDINNVPKDGFSHPWNF